MKYPVQLSYTDRSFKDAQQAAAYGSAPLSGMVQVGVLDIEPDGFLLFTDPCYLDSHGDDAPGALVPTNVMLIDAPSRQLAALAEYDNGRVVSLRLVHPVRPNMGLLQDGRRGRLVGEVGVDSGQVCVVGTVTRANWIPDPRPETILDFDADWPTPICSYETCCFITLTSDAGAGQFDVDGVVTETAHGDGVYSVYELVGSSGDLIGYEIDFGGNEYEDDDDADDWDDDWDGWGDDDDDDDDDDDWDDDDDSF